VTGLAATNPTHSTGETAALDAAAASRCRPAVGTSCGARQRRRDASIRRRQSELALWLPGTAVYPPTPCRCRGTLASVAPICRRRHLESPQQRRSCLHARPRHGRLRALRHGWSGADFAGGPMCPKAGWRWAIARLSATQAERRQLLWRKQASWPAAGSPCRRRCTEARLPWPALGSCKVWRGGFHSATNVCISAQSPWRSRRRVAACPRSSRRRRSEHQRC